MKEIFIALLFGAVQGLTEFLPISSSGHLVVLHRLFPTFQFSNDVVFDVALHVGTLCALLIVFWHDIARYAKAAIGFLRHPRQARATTDERIVRDIIITTIPAFLVGAFFENTIESTFRSIDIVATMLVAVALLFFIVEYRVRHLRSVGISLEHLLPRAALFIGVLQTLAFIPGTSRSGITIVAGMLVGLRRETAARFSFLVALPLVAAAGLKKTLDLISIGVVPAELPLLFAGIVSSAVVGMLVIRFLLRYLRTRTLRQFAWYRIFFGLFILFLFHSHIL